MYKNGLSLYQHKMAIIDEALKEFNGNKTKTAASLGISVRALRCLVHRPELIQWKKEPSVNNKNIGKNGI